MSSTMMSIQVIPTPPNREENVIPYVDKAIEVIAQSGLLYRVSPLETTMQGEIKQLLSIVAEIHQVLEQEGCPRFHTQIKLFQTSESIEMNELTQKYD